MHGPSEGVYGRSACDLDDIWQDELFFDQREAILGRSDMALNATVSNDVNNRRHQRRRASIIDERKRARTSRKAKRKQRGKTHDSPQDALESRDKDGLEFATIGVVSDDVAKLEEMFTLGEDFASFNRLDELAVEMRRRRAVEGRAATKIN